MMKWKRAFEDLSNYAFLLVFLNLLVFLEQSEMTWAISILFLFAVAAIGKWISKGPLPAQFKAYMTRNGIKPIYLWVGITVMYYGIVGLADLIF